MKKNKSLARFFRLIAFYPFLLPVWKETYFRIENTGYTVPVVISEKTLSEQKAFYLAIPDPHIRSRILKSLYSFYNPNLESFFNDLLTKEKDPVVLTDILHGLYINSFKCAHLPILKQMMKSEISSARAYSGVLYIDNANSPDDVFELLKTEKTEFVSKLIWDKLRKRKELCKKDKICDLYNKIPEFQKPYLLAILSDISEQPENEKLIREVVEAKGGLDRKIAIALSIAARKDIANGILAKFAEDADPRLRAAAARSIASESRFGFLLKLSRDTENEIRKLAVISLSGLPAATAIEAIIERLSDKELLVRNEAENALISLKITEEYLSKISSEKLKDPVAVASAIKVLGELKYLPAAEEIRKILNETQIVEVRKRALIALGKLEYTESAQDIAKFADDKEKEVRRAVAYSLGQLKEKNTFDTIRKLAADKDEEVSAEASVAIFKTADPYFEQTIISNLKRVKENFLIRSAAAKAASASCVNSESAVKELQKLALEKVILTAMGPVFDVDQARASAAWALVDIAKANAKFAKNASAVLEKLQTPPQKQDDRFISSEFLIDCAAQAQAYFEGKEAKQSEITPSSPNLIIRTIKGN